MRATPEEGTIDEIYSDESAPRADPFYEVRVMVLNVGWLRTRLRVTWSAFASVFTPWWGTLPYDLEPKLESDVQVLRRSDEAVVASYHYKIGSDARDHLHSLDQRVRTLSIADFERTLGIKRL